MVGFARRAADRRRQVALYQAPAATARLAVVVSPLIALMKDQVDGLRRPACRPPCSTAARRRDAALVDARGGRRRHPALYLAPERS
jgi:superfamily II DNA helicase RecQ